MSALLRRLSTPRGAPTAPAAPAAAPAAAAPGHAPLVIPSQDDLALDPPVWDLVVVGAGVAGAAFAHAQAAAGRRVLLLERDLAQPDRIVGELLQPGGFLALKRLGLEACTEGIDAQRVAGYAMFKGGEEAVVAYPTEGFAGDVAGRSFHHGRFVQNLRAAAAAAPGVTVRAGTVRALLGAEGTQDWDEGRGSVSGVRYRHAATGEERAARAHLTVVCDGMYSGLRKKLVRWGCGGGGGGGLG
jgi:squalene monooxygenase